MNTRLKTSVVRLLAGTLIAAGLFGLTSVAAGQEISQPALQAQWQQLKTTDWIADGAPKPRHVLYAFIDPNCPYCHDLWRDAQTHYKHGLQVRYILVGIISDTSPTKAAAILESDNPLQALRQNEKQWGASPDGSPGGGIAPLRQLDFSMRLKLMMHFKLAREFGILGTPGLVWKDRSGTIHVLQSAPPPAQLAQIVESATDG